MKFYNFVEVSANFALQPAEALALFRDKGLKTSFAWQDMIGEEHTVAFTVAKMMDSDLLATVRDKLDAAIASGKTLRDFQKELIPSLQKAGWWGKKDVIDPLTGKVVKAQLGSASRLETIFRTNLQSAYSVGRWDMISKNATSAPFLMYDAVDDNRTRPEHAALDNTVLPVTSSFWDSFMPPNGWNCRCGVIQLDGDQLRAYGLSVSKQLRIRMRSWKNPRTGKIHKVPENLDPGWDHNPGKERLGNLTRLQREKINAQAEAVRKSLAKARPAPPPAVEEIIEAGFKPWEAQKTVKDAEAFMQRHGYAENVDMGKLDVDVVNAVGESLSFHMGKYPEIKQSVAYVGSIQAKYKTVYDRQYAYHLAKAREMWPERPATDHERMAKRRSTRRQAKGEWAHAAARNENPFYRGTHGIALNEKFGATKGKKSLLDGLKSGVESKFHPAGCDSMRSIMDHELGHALDFLLGLSQRSDIRKLWESWGGVAETLSRYARTNLAEFIAEAWAEYLNNPEPRPIAKEMGSIVERAYKEKFG